MNNPDTSSPRELTPTEQALVQWVILYGEEWVNIHNLQGDKLTQILTMLKPLHFEEAYYPECQLVERSNTYVNEYRLSTLGKQLLEKLDEENDS